MPGNSRRFRIDYGATLLLGFILAPVAAFMFDVYAIAPLLRTFNLNDAPAVKNFFGLTFAAALIVLFFGLYFLDRFSLKHWRRRRERFARDKNEIRVVVAEHKAKNISYDEAHRRVTDIVRYLWPSMLCDEEVKTWCKEYSPQNYSASGVAVADSYDDPPARMIEPETAPRKAFDDGWDTRRVFPFQWSEGFLLLFTIWSLICLLGALGIYAQMFRAMNARGYSFADLLLLLIPSLIMMLGPVPWIFMARAQRRNNGKKILILEWKRTDGAPDRKLYGVLRVSGGPVIPFQVKLGLIRAVDDGTTDRYYPMPLSWSPELPKNRQAVTIAPTPASGMKDEMRCEMKIILPIPEDAPGPSADRRFEPSHWLYVFYGKSDSQWVRFPVFIAP